MDKDRPAMRTFTILLAKGSDLPAVSAEVAKLIPASRLIQEPAICMGESKMLLDDLARADMVALLTYEEAKTFAFELMKAARHTGCPISLAW